MFVKDTKRALRRHHKNRMKAKAIRVYYFLSPENAVKLADNLHPCSCYGCGNQRQYEGAPIRELRKSVDIDEESSYDVTP